MTLLLDIVLRVRMRLFNANPFCLIALAAQLIVGPAVFCLMWLMLMAMHCVSATAVRMGMVPAGRRLIVCFGIVQQQELIATNHPLRRIGLTEAGASFQATATG